MLNITYSTPALCGSDLTSPWFVYFTIRNEQTGEARRLQFRGRINYYSTIPDRQKEATRFMAFWKNKLKQGWHPFEDAESKLVHPFTPFYKALDFAFEKCDVGSATRKDYRVTVNFVQQALERLGLKNYPAGEIQHQHILLILDDIQKHRGWSNHAYNKNAGYLCSILGRLKKWKVFTENPAEGVEMKTVVETKKYVSYTEAEKQTIREHLYLHHYRFFVYLMVLYHTGIRPKEILHLRIRDVNVGDSLITIYPDQERENSKTPKIRYVPINKHLLPFFREMNLSSYDPDCYLFGSPYESGKGNRGSYKKGITGAKHPDYFKPSMVMIKRDTVTKLWNEVVIDKLGIKKHLYAAKHTGADDKILAGVNVDALKTLYGHSSKLMTEKYISVLQQLHAKEIKELSPEF